MGDNTLPTGKSLVSQLKDELAVLLQKLKKNESSYISCVKPNSTNTPFVFDGGMVAKQLKNCGLNAVLDLMTQGFPRRITYTTLKNSSKQYLPPNMQQLEAKAFCSTLLANRQIPEDAVHFGKTMLFLKNGVLSQIDELEKLSPMARQQLLREFARELSIRRFRKGVYTVICTQRLQKAITRRRAAFSRWRSLLLELIFIIRLKKPIQRRKALQDFEQGNSEASGANIAAEMPPESSQAAVQSASEPVDAITTARRRNKKGTSKKAFLLSPEPISKAKETLALKIREAEKTLALKKKAVELIGWLEDWRSTSVNELIDRNAETRLMYCKKHPEKSYNTLEKIKDHIFLVDLERKYECFNCESTFRGLRQLKSHLRSKCYTVDDTIQQYVSVIWGKIEEKERAQKLGAILSDAEKSIADLQSYIINSNSM